MGKINNTVSSAGEPMFLSYLHAKGKALGLPVSVTFEITRRCNFRCKMCYVHSDGCNAAADELTAGQWLEIGRQARDAGSVTLLLTGGEPLLRRDFTEIFSGLKKLGLLVSVNTNGSLIDDRITDFFIADPPARLNISLYGASEETYERLCGGRYYNKVYNNIKRLREADIQVRLNMSITPDNGGDMEAMLKLAEELGVHAKATTYMYPPMRTENGVFGQNSGRFSPREAAFHKVKYDLIKLGREEFLRRADAFEKNSGMPRDDECELTDEGEGMRCRAGASSCWINSAGGMSICGIFTPTVHSVLTEGFDKCWSDVRKEASLIRLPAKCSDCSLRSVCPMCAAVCYTETGTFDRVPSYACEYSEAVADYIRETAERLRNGN